MCFFYAILAAFFSGITTLFAKCGASKVDSTVATLIRTIIIMITTWLIIIIFNYEKDLTKINFRTTIFLVFSGITTGFLWLCYFKALALGSINKVTPVDKSSIVLTMILSFLILKEKITIIKIISSVLIIFGAVLMISKAKDSKKNNLWLIWAILTAVFTSVSTIISKIGLENINSILALGIRTLIVVLMTIVMALFSKKIIDLKKISKKDWMFIILSGLSTTFAWTFYFLALKHGEASKVFSVEKLSVFFAVIFSVIFLKEKISKKGVVGLILIIFGTIIIMF